MISPFSFLSFASPIPSLLPLPSSIVPLLAFFSSFPLVFLFLSLSSFPLFSPFLYLSLLPFSLLFLFPLPLFPFFRLPIPLPPPSCVCCCCSSKWRSLRNTVRRLRSKKKTSKKCKQDDQIYKRYIYINLNKNEIVKTIKKR